MPSVEDNSKLDGQEEADKIFRANCSLRYKRMDALERWVSGRQYDGQPSFWDDDQPLWDRAPCLVYPVTSLAIDSFVDLICGGSRFAEFSTKPDEDESDEEDGLDPDNSETVDRFIKSWHKRARFRSVTAEVLASAMGAGSAALIHGIRNGRPFNDLIPGKWCEPTFGQDGVAKIEIRYAYQESYRDPRTNKWTVRTRLYRRVIDDKRDIEYLPGDANIQGIEPSWQENPARSVDHGFGFCPVVWYPFMRGNVPVSVIDGEAIHTNFTDEIRGHDMARSQWHRGALMSEPQVYETGIPSGYNPTETGVTPVVVTTEHGGKPSPQNPVTGAFVDRPGGGRGKPARKRGPGYVWQYPEKATVAAIFYPADALKAQSDNCADLRLKLMEMFGVVLLDPESLKSIHQLSGKALEALKQKQLDRCDRIRDDLNEHLLQPSIAMQLRIARKVLGKAKLSVAGATKVGTVLQKFGDGVTWEPPSVQTKWGEYLRSDPQEQLALVNLVLLAVNSATPVLTVRAAVQKLAPIFGIDNIDAFIEQIEKESSDRSAKKSADSAGEIRAAVAQLTKPKLDDNSAAPGEAKPGQGPERAKQAAAGGAA